MNNKIGLIIFDLDDTLLDTSDVYWRAKKSFFNLFKDKKIPDTIIDEIFERVEAKNIKIYGHEIQRYKISMIETYNNLSDKYNFPIDEIDLKNIEKAGNIINEIPQIINGAVDLLEWASKYYELILISRGEDGFQRKKILVRKLDKYFNHIYIVDDKNKKLFNNTIINHNYKPIDTWIIGDSIKSEINPCVKINCKCILYKYTHHSYVWIQEYNEKLESDVFQVTDLRNVIDIIKKTDHDKFFDFSTTAAQEVRQ